MRGFWPLLSVSVLTRYWYTICGDFDGLSNHISRIFLLPGVFLLRVLETLFYLQVSVAQWFVLLWELFYTSVSVSGV